MQRKYPNESHYAFVSNSPLLYIDPDGRDKIVTLTIVNKDGTQIKIKSVNPNYFYTQTNYGYYETTFSKFDVTSNIVIDYSKPDANGRSTGSITNDIVRSSEKSTSMVGYALQNVENALTDRKPVVKEFGFVLSGEAAGDNHTLDLGGFSKSAELIDIGSLMKTAGNLREFSGKLEVWDFAEDGLKKSPGLMKLFSVADNLLDGTQSAIDAAEVNTNSDNTKPPMIIQNKTAKGKWQYSNANGGATNGGTTSTSIKKSNNPATPDTLVKTRHTRTPNPSKKKN